MNRRVQLIPLAFLRGQQRQNQIRADAEIFSLIGDDHRLEILLGLFEPGIHHAELILAERVHLAVKLDAQHAVAHVDQRCSRVPLYHAARALDVR